MRSIGLILFAAALSSAQQLPPAPDAWQKHRDAESLAMRDRKFDVAEREGLAAYLEALKMPAGDKRIALTVVEWAESCAGLQRGRDAEALFERALAMYRQAGDNNGVERAIAGLIRASWQSHRSDYNHPNDKTAAKLREALALMTKSRRQETIMASNLMNTLGVYQNYDGDYVGAQKVLLRSVMLQENEVNLTNFADVERHMGYLADAEQRLQRAMTVDASHQASGDQRTTLGAQRLYHLGLLYSDQGQIDIAEIILKQALEAETNNAWRADIHRALGNLYRERGKFTEASAFYDRDLELLKDAYPNTAGVRFRADCLVDIGLNAMKQRNYARANASFQEAQETYGRLLRADHPAIAIVMWRRAMLLQEQRKPADAAGLMSKALPILEQAAGTSAPILIGVLKDYAAIQQSAGNASAAQTMRARAAAIIPPPPSNIPPSSAALVEQIETAYWDSLQRRKDPTVFQAYVREFPYGRFVDQAKRQAGTEAAALPLPENPPCPKDFDSVPAEKFAECVAAWSKAGFAPSALAVYQVSGQTFAVGSFERSTPRLFTVMLSEQEQVKAVESNGERGYRPDIMDVLHTPTGPRYTTTWESLPGGHAGSEIFQTPAALKAEIERRNNPKQLFTTLVGVRPARFVTAWRDDAPYAEVKLFYDIAPADTQQLFNSQMAAGMLPYRRWIYPSANGLRHSWIWVRGPATATFSRTGMTKSAFLAFQAELAAKGYTLRHVNVAGADFVAIWWRDQQY